MVKTVKKENGKREERKWRRGKNFPGRHYVDEEHRTPAYEKAVAALIALREEDPGLMTPAFAEAATTYKEQVYRRRHGLNKSRAGNTFDRLIGKRTYFGYNNLWQRWMDHSSLWLKDGRPYLFVGQPYGLTLRDLREIAALCDEHGLTAEVDAGLSWWYPGRTLLVEMRHEQP